MCTYVNDFAMLDDVARRVRLRRDDAQTTYIRAGELEVFRQLQRDGETLDTVLSDERAIAVGPFGRVSAEAVVDALGKTRGAINHLWGNQEAFRAAIMHVFLNDAGLGLDEVDQPEPADCADIDEWLGRWAAAEIDRGPRHGMEPENCYGLRWAAWLGLVPYGIWSDTVASASMDEYRSSVEHTANDLLAPALERFDLDLANGTTLTDVALAATTAIEGSWLNAALTAGDPAGRNKTITQSLTTTLRLIVRGATTPR